MRTSAADQDLMWYVHESPFPVTYFKTDFKVRYDELY
jgi:hypothetical protein